MILLACRFSGKFRKNKPKKNRQIIRETKCFHQNWSSEIYLAASEDGNDLEVLRINLEYNHEMYKDLYETLPRQGSLPAAGHVLEEVKSAIELKANNKFLP